VGSTTGFVEMGDWAVSIMWTRCAFITAALFRLNLAWMWAFLNWSLVLYKFVIAPRHGQIHPWRELELWDLQ
jgi:hypothetical protein